jgi:hypothetical protein
MNLQLPPTLDHLGLEISGFDQISGLASPCGFTRMIGDLFPITLCGRSIDAKCPIFPPYL